MKATGAKPHTIGRAGKCVDDDDDDFLGRKQRNCLTLAAPGGERRSRPRQRQTQFLSLQTSISPENQVDLFVNIDLSQLSEVMK